MKVPQARQQNRLTRGLAMGSLPKPFQKSPYCDDLPKVEFVVVDLCNEDGSEGLIQSGAIHVNGSSHGQNKPRDASVHTVVFFQAPEGDGQSR